MGDVSNRRKATRSPRAGLREHDEHTVPGNDEFDEDVVLSVSGGVAAIRPASFDRLSADAREHAMELLQLVGQRRQIANEIDGLIAHMRSMSVSWNVIGWCVGTSSEAARQRWGDGDDD